MLQKAESTDKQFRRQLVKTLVFISLQPCWQYLKHIQDFVTNPQILMQVRTYSGKIRSFWWGQSILPSGVHNRDFQAGYF